MPRRRFAFPSFLGRRFVAPTLLAGLTIPAAAADPPPAPRESVNGKSVATTPAEADADFPFVGEYWGVLYVKNGDAWEKATVGLQLAARGNGNFEATEYLGGLPGDGWSGGDYAILPAARAGDAVDIPASPLGMRVDGTFATVGEYGKGPVYGFLRRTHRESPTLGKAPPAEAAVLFDGTSTAAFKGAGITADGLLTVGGETLDPVGDFTMHLEFLLPYMPAARDQGRANSGVYIQRRYEVQILDSFGEPPAFNTAGSLYRTKPADMNMSYPPLVWQTYDIRFEPAKFEGESKVQDARITLWHNGVKVQDRYAIPHKTGAGKAEGPDPLPLLLQDHGNPVRFRNVWLLDHAKHPNVDATPKPFASPLMNHSPSLGPDCPCGNN